MGRRYAQSQGFSGAGRLEHGVVLPATDLHAAFRIRPDQQDTDARLEYRQEADPPGC